MTKKTKNPFKLWGTYAGAAITYIWFGVEIRTDSDWYDWLYKDEGYYVNEEEAKEFGIKAGSIGGFQKELNEFVNKKMKFKKDDHYLEPYGGGILHYY